MTSAECDIFISGAGPAGMMAALVMADAGYSVVLADPAPFTTGESDDVRTTAFLQPAQTFFAELGVWNSLEPSATELQIMRIADTDPSGEIRVTKAFDASEISDRPFGWNLRNRDVRRVLSAAISSSDAIRVLPCTKTRSLTLRETGALVRLDDGSSARARLVMGADGRNSTIRSEIGVGKKTYRYSQRAIVFSVEHEADHCNTSTEVHASGGPFTLVPLPSDKGRNFSSVVWMEQGRAAQRIMALDPEAFGEAATARSAGTLGRLRLVGERAVWPVISQISDRLTAQRTALIAEAAHVVPPIGAQGLNMSFADIRELRDLSKQYELGGRDMLGRYEKRRTELLVRIKMLDALNRTSMAGNFAIRDLRTEGLRLIHSMPPIRKGLMRAGLGSPR